MKLLLLAAILLFGGGQHVPSSDCYKPAKDFQPPPVPVCPEGTMPDANKVAYCKLQYQLKMSQIETNRCQNLADSAKKYEDKLNECLKDFKDCWFPPEDCQNFADACIDQAAEDWNTNVNMINDVCDQAGEIAADRYEDCMKDACSGRP